MGTFHTTGEYVPNNEELESELAREQMMKANERIKLIAKYGACDKCHKPLQPWEIKLSLDYAVKYWIVRHDCEGRQKRVASLCKACGDKLMVQLDDDCCVGCRWNHPEQGRTNPDICAKCSRNWDDHYIGGVE